MAFFLNCLSGMLSAGINASASIPHLISVCYSFQQGQLCNHIAETVV